MARLELRLGVQLVSSHHPQPEPDRGEASSIATCLPGAGEVRLGKRRWPATSYLNSSRGPVLVEPAAWPHFAGAAKAHPRLAWSCRVQRIEVDLIGGWIRAIRNAEPHPDSLDLAARAREHGVARLARLSGRAGEPADPGEPGCSACIASSARAVLSWWWQEAEAWREVQPRGGCRWTISSAIAGRPSRALVAARLPSLAGAASRLSGARAARAVAVPGRRFSRPTPSGARVHPPRARLMPYWLAGRLLRAAGPAWAVRVYPAPMKRSLLWAAFYCGSGVGASAACSSATPVLGAGACASTWRTEGFQEGLDLLAFSAPGADDGGA